MLGRPSSQAADPVAVLAAYVTFYDQRGGGIETSLKGDKQGLGLTKRSKKRFEAQQMVVLLGSLAHNVVVWARRWLSSPLYSTIVFFEEEVGRTRTFISTRRPFPA